RLAIVDFADKKDLYKEGHNYYAVENGAGRHAVPAEIFEMRQGMLENSNVKSVEEMVDMVTVTRPARSQSSFRTRP
ncbi:flagellar basal body rod C-terminal domain-containing protein, partial [candidate division KSB1 bacterium]